jgi:hypothetical protein
MTQDTTYNGWTNYATWRVNLEIFDFLAPADMGWDALDIYELTTALKDYAYEAIEGSAPEGLALSYARAFLGDVNWGEIARHKVAEYA